MKTLRLALVTLFGFAFIFSCTKEKSFETGGGGSVNAEWEFKEGKEYKGTVDTAYIEDFGTPIKTLFLEGPSLDGKALLSIEVINISTSNPATYKTPQVKKSFGRRQHRLFVLSIIRIIIRVNIFVT